MVGWWQVLGLLRSADNRVPVFLRALVQVKDFSSSCVVQEKPDQSGLLLELNLNYNNRDTP